MNTRTLFPIVAVACLTMIAVARGAGPAEKTFAVAGQPSLTLGVPPGWKDTSVMPPPGSKLPPLVRFEANDAAGAFSVQITFLKSPPGKVPTDADVKQMATGINTRNAAGSVEKKTDLRLLKGDQLFGYTASFTDASADPGEFPCVTTVTGRLGEGLIVTTILHQKESKNLPLAIEMMRTATSAAPATQPAATQATSVRVVSPDGKWAAVIDLPNADPADAENSVDGKATRLETRTADGVLLTAFIEPAAGPGDAKAVRTYYWNRAKQSPIPYTKVFFSGDDKVAVVSSLAAGEFPDVHAYLAHDGRWVDLHLSRPSGNNPAPGGMSKIARTARIEIIKP